jgi:phage repressor protein C with HTH and peptisase S24 domain
VRPLSNGTGHPTKIKAPAVYGPLLALTVVGDAMYPRYLDKDIILCAKAPAPPEECIGKECVVQIENGQTMLRWVHKGASTGKYVLTSHNQPPIVDATIILARPVIKP